MKEKGWKEISKYGRIKLEAMQMDNPKLKKLDSKRVALTQKHEVNYCRRIARQLSDPFKFIVNNTRPKYYELSDKELRKLQNHGSKTIRLAKAFLKATDGKHLYIKVKKEDSKKIKRQLEIIESNGENI